ncbi:hypothetical protein AB8Q24_26020, partial [Klebsiella pneumoniae subsp. ozaenae]
LLCHGTVCVVGKMRDLILQLSKSSIYSTKPNKGYKDLFHGWVSGVFIPEQSMLITEKAFDLRAG